MPKTILVTGSSKGIGASIIKKFAKENYNVIITYNNSYEDALDLEKYIKDNYPVETLIIKCDISKEDDIINLKDEVENKFNKIDILVNNAALSLDSKIKDKTKDEFMRVLEVNLCGTFLMMKHFVDISKDIINISSLDSTKTFNSLEVDYIASKAGINTLTKTFSLEYKNNRFISILLPWVNTEAIREMNPLYLEEVLKECNQTRLMEVNEVSDKLFDIINSDIESGSIIEVNYD